MSMVQLPEVPLSSLAQVNPPRAAHHLSPNAEVTFIPMGDVTEDGRWTGTQTRLLKEVRNGFTCFGESDVLFAKITPCMENGKGCLPTELVNSIGFGSTEFHVLRAKPESNAGYIHQWTMYDELRRQARNSMTGSAGQQRVPAGFFDKFVVPSFSLPEQTKIAEILTTVDRAIEQTEALVAKQQRLKTGLMQDLLTRGIDAQGNLRTESTHPFKDSPLGRIPTEWEVGSLMDIASKNRQPILTGPFGADLGTDDFIDEGAPVLRIGNVQNRYLDLRDLLFVRPTKAASLARYSIQSGDILFARQGATTGRNSLATDEVSGWLINYHIIRVALDHSRCSPLFIEAVLNSDDVVNQVSKEKGRGTREGINSAQLKALRFRIPPANEQYRIADIFAKKSSESDESKKQLAKLRALKTALMQDLLTGRKRVTALL